MAIVSIITREKRVFLSHFPGPALILVSQRRAKNRGKRGAWMAYQAGARLMVGEYPRDYEADIRDEWGMATADPTHTFGAWLSLGMKTGRLETKRNCR